ncbi:S-adenosyl-L-methionine-dependent methyltransferase [Panus rudis PR-1116 ss-1]|nr:S-adenosyl-L-methionine-dependent methyltransferase [Panus rudis PR-1116 ss-1]
MSSQLLSTAYTHPLSLSALADKAWTSATEAALKLSGAYGWSNPLCKLAEAGVINTLQNITNGQLRIQTPSRTYVFPKSITSSNKNPTLLAEIRVLKPTFWLRLALMSDLGFAEAYMFGEADCPDLISLFSIFLNNRAALSSMSVPLASVMTRISNVLAHSHFVNSLGNARGNISAHYDIGNDMFMGFLSRDMTYSCAIFRDLDGDLRPAPSASPSRSPAALPGAMLGKSHGNKPVLPAVLVHTEGDNHLDIGQPLGTASTGSSTPTVVSTDDEDHGATKIDINKLKSHVMDAVDTITSDYADDEDELYEAQIRKLEHIIKKCDIRPGHRVLEIGSGWGSMALQITRTIPGTTVDTLTLSVQQQEITDRRIREVYGEKGHERVRCHLMDYRDMPAEWEGAFDRVVSIEMIEAVGKEFLETYWSQVNWALKKDTGVGCVQVITIPESRYDAYSQGTDFIQKWVFFPGGHLPTLTHLITSLTAGSKNSLVVDSVSNIGPHYARTLREWRRRFEWSFDSVIVPALKKEYPEMSGPNGEFEIEVFRRKWIYYYCYCEIGFSTRTLGDHIITFAREGYDGYGCQVYA